MLLLRDAVGDGGTARPVIADKVPSDESGLAVNVLTGALETGHEVVHVLHVVVDFLRDH